MNASFEAVRRNLRGRALAIAVVTTLLLVGGLWPFAPGVLAHPHHLRVASPGPGLTSEPLHESRLLAQSFLVDSNFSVSRLSLHVSDVGGSDPLAVSLRADDGGAPGATNLTGGSLDGLATPGWYDVDLSPHVVLAAGETYWIVGSSPEGAGDGYAWSHVVTEYPDGTAMASSDGSTWSGIALVDLAFRGYGYASPVFDYSVSAGPAAVEPGNVTVLQVWFNNTGTNTAGRVWINVTYPSALNYVADDAADEGGIRTGASYSFTGVEPGAHAMNVTARVEAGVADGTVAPVHLTFEAADHDGAPPTHDERETALTVQSARLSYAASVSPPSLTPEETAAIRVVFNNTGNGSAARVWANLTLPAELRYVSDDAATLGGVRTGTFDYAFANKTSGEYVFNVSVAAEGGIVHGEVAPASVTFEARDPAGAPLDSSAWELEVALSNARLSANVAADPSSADPGDPVTFAATIDNVGGDDATNLTLTGAVDPNTTYLSSSPGGSYDGATRTVLWTLGLLEAGDAAAFEWTVEVKAGTEDSAAAPAWFRAEYQDATGASMPPENVSTAVGIQAPLFAPAVVPDQTEAQRSDEVSVYFYYNNTGSAPSPRGWANWTLNGHYELVGLAPDQPYVWTPAGFSVHLADIDPGDHFFVAKLQVLPSGPDALPMDLTVNWTAWDGNENPLPEAEVATVVTLQAPSLSPLLRIDRAAAERGDRIEATLYYNNTGSVSAQWVWLNWSFGAHYAFVSLMEDLPLLTTPDGIAVLDPDVGPGTHLLTVALRATTGSPDGLDMALKVILAPADGRGNPLQEAELLRVVTLQAPTFSPLLLLDRTEVERDDVVLARLHVNNTGSATASRAWANWSLNGHYLLEGLTPEVSTSPLEDGFSVSLENLAPDAHLLEARLRVVRGMEDGLPLALEVRWDALDGNGYPLGEASLGGAAALLAPTVRVRVTGPSGPVVVGAPFALNVTLANEGRAFALGTLRLVLPEGLEYGGDDGSFPVAEGNGTLSWEVAALPAGGTVDLSVTLRARTLSEASSLQFLFLATDEGGGPARAVTSNAVPVVFLPPPPLLVGPWVLLAFAVATVVPGGLLLRRRRDRSTNIEEVFVIDGAGLLLAHRSRSLLNVVDEDILSAMFTAIQAFIHDAFSQGTDETIRALDFGERTILVERRSHHFVALVCREPDEKLEARLEALSDEIEGRFGDVLADWDGDTAKVAGISNLLPVLWQGAPRR